MALVFREISQYDCINTVLFPDEASCFYGTAVDERSETAIELLKKSSAKSFHFSYDHRNYRMQMGNTKDHWMNIANSIRNIDCNEFVIEATSLAFPEILLLLNAINENPAAASIKLLYVEPKEYRLRQNKVYSYDDFDLSQGYEQFAGIPGFIKSRDQKIPIAVFLGFERTRLGQLLNNDDFSTYNKLAPIVPLPAFVLGWENRTINHHLEYFTSEFGFTRLFYAGASNPYRAYRCLEEISFEHNHSFRVIPIGTKPNAIGCAAFLVNSLHDKEKEVDVLFDFPEKKKNRSDGIGKINVYTLSVKHL